MATGRRRLVRSVAGCALGLAVAVAGWTAGLPRPASPSGGPAGASAVADGLPPHVHLRKLHLVRPDLIPYPVEYAIYC